MIKFANDTIPRADLEALARDLPDMGQLTQGRYVAAFERSFAQWVGKKYGVMVNSGSSALLLMWAAMREMGYRKAVVPAVCWPTTVAPAIQLGFQLEAVDVDERWGIDISQTQLTSQSVVMAVHMLGVPCNWDVLAGAAQAYGCPVLEDACGAHGATWRGKRVGSLGLMSAFSFYWGHHISTIEGGMVLTDDDQCCDLLRMLRSHGWANDLPPDAQETMHRTWSVPAARRKFTFYVPGYNVRATEIAGYLGCRQMEHLDQRVRARWDNRSLYFRQVDGLLGCQILGPNNVPSPIGMGLLAHDADHRWKIMQALEANEIESRVVGTGNVTMQPFWLQNVQRDPHQQLPMADMVHDRAFQVPCHHELTEQDIDRVCEVIRGSA